MNYLSLSAYAFDQTDQGWRSLDSDGMYQQAADLIIEYINTNAGAITSNPSLESLYFHAGQEYAMAGNEYYEDAIKCFNKSYRNNNIWNAYVRGSIAYIEKNEFALNTEIQYVSKADTSDSQLLSILKKFQNALSKGVTSYKEAY